MPPDKRKTPLAGGAPLKTIALGSGDRSEYKAPRAVRKARPRRRPPHRKLIQAFRP